MDICDGGISGKWSSAYTHDTVVYEGRTCPLCDMIKGNQEDVDQLQKRIAQLEDEVASLESEIAEQRKIF